MEEVIGVVDVGGVVTGEMLKKLGHDTVSVPKIKNGSTLIIGNKYAKTTLKADQHFNWFQKLMWKWCFGVKVEDYSEE